MNTPGFERTALGDYVPKLSPNGETYLFCHLGSPTPEPFLQKSSSRPVRTLNPSDPGSGSEIAPENQQQSR